MCSRCFANQTLQDVRISSDALSIEKDINVVYFRRCLLRHLISISIGQMRTNGKSILTATYAFVDCDTRTHVLLLFSRKISRRYIVVCGRACKR